MDGMPFRRGPDERFQPIAVRHTDGCREKVSQILRDGDIFEEINGCIRRDLDHDVDVAVWAVIATGAAAE
jgi:hypothetical protein